MSQRKYVMRQRAAAVEATRRRILEATSACHREQGIVATSIEDVARRAGVALGTVYRHYPTLDSLVGACGAVFMDRFALPDPEQARECFRGLRKREERLSRLVDEIAARYRSAAIGFVRAREAKASFAATAVAHERIEASLDALVDEAVRPLHYTATRRRVLRALVDARVWQALTDQGVEPTAVEETLRALVAAV
jgi:AcrR family transcriptional regulator